MLWKSDSCWCRMDNGFGFRHVMLASSSGYTVMIANGVHQQYRYDSSCEFACIVAFAVSAIASLVQALDGT